jgi:ParB-like nuclease domain
VAICALGKEKFEIKSAATQIATNEVIKMGTNPQNRIIKFARDGLPLRIQRQVQLREGAPTSTSPSEEDSCLSGQERFAMEGMEWTPAHLKVACAGESLTIPTKGRDIILSAKEAESLPIPIKLFLMMAFQIGAIGFPDKSYYQRNPFHSIKRFIEFPGGLSADGMREWGHDPVLSKLAERHSELRNAKLSCLAGKKSEEHFVHNSPLAAITGGTAPLPAEGEPAHISTTPTLLELICNGQKVHMILPQELTPHPFNRKIYDVELDAEFLSSIELFGVQEPIVATPGKIVLGGERRLLAAIKCRLPNVPVVFTDLPEEVHEALIIHLNRQRKKSPLELIREFIAKKELAAVEAKFRQMAGKRLVEIFPQGCKSGKARDNAAKDSEFCGKLMDNAAKAYLEAMRRQQAGIAPDEVAAVLAKLNQRYSPAYNLAIDYGWFPHKAGKHKNLKTSVNGLLAETIASVTTTLQDNPAALRLMTSSLPKVRRTLDARNNTRGVEALRQYANALLSLADKMEKLS